MAVRGLVLVLLICGCGWAADFNDLAARAAAARDANDIPKAIELYKQALALNPKWQEGWWYLGTLAYDSDRYAIGRDAFQHLVDLNTKATPAWGLLGLCEFETASYTKSLADIQHALSLGAGKEPQIGPVLLYHEALLLTRAGRFDEAVQKYSALLHSGEENPSLFPALGLAALRAPLLPKEIAAGRQDLYTAAGKTAALVLAGDYPRAGQAFHDLLQRYPAARNVHYMYGVFLLVEDPNRSILELKRELEIDPSNSDALTMLAWGLLNRGDAAVALPYAEKAARAAPEDANAQYVCGRALLETGEVQRGLQYLERAEKMNPNSIEVHLVLATGYSKAARPVEARRERAISMAMAKEQEQVAKP